MADILMLQQDDGSWDAAMFGGDLVVDNSMRAAAFASLLTDREAEDSTPGERRGWWGDLFNASPDDRIGSLLWTLQKKGKLSSQTLSAAKTYSEQALAWMIEDGLAKTVAVTPSLGEVGELNIKVDIGRPDGTTESILFADIWNQNYKSDAAQQIIEQYDEMPDITSLLEHVYYDQLPGIDPHG